MSHTKICVRCGIDQQIEFFNWINKKDNKRKGACKECTRKYAMSYYRNNTDKMKANSRRSNKRRIKSNQEKYHEFLLKHPCDCGESDPIVLDPDHNRDKKHNISKMVKHGYCWDKVLEELAKCTIRCANCHRRKTAKEQNWRKVELNAGGRQASQRGS